MHFTANGTTKLHQDNQESSIVYLRTAPKYNERFDFDDVVKSLMLAPLATRSCVGTHVLYSLAFIRQVDKSDRILSENVASDLNEFLVNMSKYVERQQLPDGAINPYWASKLGEEGWYAGNAGPKVGRMAGLLGVNSSESSKVLATAHHVEWLWLLEEFEQPNVDFFRGAARYLHLSLRTLAHDEIAYEFCPYTHAIGVLTVVSNLGLGEKSL